MCEVKKYIENGNAILGIEFGSTRIKAVLIGNDNAPIAMGVCNWENDLIDGIWTYSLDQIQNSLRDCYQSLLSDVKKRYDCSITNLKAIGFSGMMHGYIALDEDENLLVPFRTWRNMMTGRASEELTQLFGFHIPQRWSIAHLYQAILNDESHVKKLRTLFTLSGYIQWIMTGEKTVGIGEASGMFPIDAELGNYNQKMIDAFEKMIEHYHYPWKLIEVLPKVLLAGDVAGYLTQKGASYLDVTGTLQPGAMICPCEGDAGTGMCATNAVAVHTGNVSAGTSAFGMVVLEHDLSRAYEELDMVTTPDGHPVAMAHCNNCTSDLNAWVGLFIEFADCMGLEVDTDEIFRVLYQKALDGESNCKGLLSYNYFSGEHIMGIEEGRPLFARMPNANFNLSNFMRANLMTSLSVVKTGLDILFKEEDICVDEIMGHGGLFKTPVVGQKLLAGAINTPVSVMETAGEGGAWGIALLASYMVRRIEGESLDEFLKRAVFVDTKYNRIEPDPKDVEGFNEFSIRYTKCLSIERAAINAFR